MPTARIRYDARSSSAKGGRDLELREWEEKAIIVALEVTSAQRRREDDNNDDRNKRGWTDPLPRRKGMGRSEGPYRQVDDEA